MYARTARWHRGLRPLAGVRPLPAAPPGHASISPRRSLSASAVRRLHYVSKRGPTPSLWGRRYKTKEENSTVHGMDGMGRVGASYQWADDDELRTNQRARRPSVRDSLAN